MLIELKPPWVVWKFPEEPRNYPGTPQKNVEPRKKAKKRLGPGKGPKWENLGKRFLQDKPPGHIL